MRRVLPAAPDVVYDEWLDPAALADWMCPRPTRCRNVESEPWVGGRLRIDIEDSGTEVYVSGEYLALDRPRRLRFSWTCSTWPDPSLASVVTVLLEPTGHEQTLMTIEHTLLPPDLLAQHQRGWTAIADQLAAELSAYPEVLPVTGCETRACGPLTSASPGAGSRLRTSWLSRFRLAHPARHPGPMRVALTDLTEPYYMADRRVCHPSWPTVGDPGPVQRVGAAAVPASA